MNAKIGKAITQLLERFLDGRYINLEDLKSLVKNGEVSPRTLLIPEAVNMECLLLFIFRKLAIFLSSV